MPELSLHEGLIEQTNTRGCMVEYCSRLNAAHFPDAKFPESLERLVLRHGVGRYCLADRWYGIKRGQLKDCYPNATRLTSSDPDRFIYMEGYGIRPELGIVVGEHAWVLDRERNFEIVDPTWRNTKGAAYIGIPFRFDYLIRQQRETRQYALLDAYWSGWPIKRLPVSEWLHPEAEQLPRDFIVPDNLPDPTIELARIQRSEITIHTGD